MNTDKLLEIEKALKQSQNDCELVEKNLAKKLIEINLLTNMLKDSIVTWIKLMENDYSSVEDILEKFLIKLKHNNQDLTEEDIDELNKKQNQILKSAEQIYLKINSQESSILDKFSEKIKIKTPLKYDDLFKSDSNSNSFFTKLDEKKISNSEELDKFKEEKKKQDLEKLNLNNLLEKIP